jgi:multidrug resistance efflux pump
MESGNRSEATQAQVGRDSIPVRKNHAGQRKEFLHSLLTSPLAFGAILIFVGIAAFYGVRYWQDEQSKVYVENSELSAPVISIGPETPGILKSVYVKEGDPVSAGQQLFSVGNTVVSARVAGVITSVQNTPGQWVSQQSAIVQMYDPASLRVVGHVQEDQSLSDIRVGQSVAFTADAFPARQFVGTVESIANDADQGNLVFSISDKRQEKQFAIKITFDVNAYPELRNGMSTKVWVSK